MPVRWTQRSPTTRRGVRRHSATLAQPAPLTPACHDVDVIREAERGIVRMRVWMNAEGPLDEAIDGLAVEWAGQVGHPSSYGLLGGRAGEVTRLEVPERGSYQGSLAGASDEVAFGLPAEYRQAVGQGLRSPVALTVAAHGQVGSSAYVFRRLASLLSALISDGVPATDPDLWLLWDSQT